MKIKTLVVPLAVFGIAWAVAWYVTRERPAAARPQSQQPPAKVEITLTPDDVGTDISKSNDLNATAASWAAKKPGLFFQWILTTEPMPSDEVLMAFFKAWIESDPMAAFAAVAKLPERFGAKNTRFFLDQWTHLMYRDPAMAIQCLSMLPGESRHLMPISKDTMPDFQSVKGPELALQLRSIPVTTASRTLATRYAEYLAAKNVDEARSWAESLPPEYGAAAMGPILGKWYESDPAGSLAYLAKAPSAIKQAWAATHIARFTGMSPREKMKWLGTNVGISSYTGIDNVLQRWVEDNPAEATNYVMNETEGQDREAAIKGLTQAYSVNHNANEVLGWINGLPENERRNALQAAMKCKMPLQFPEVMDYLETIPAEKNSFATELVSSIGSNLAHLPNNEAQKLITWAAERSDTLGQTTLETILSKVNQMDHDTAAAFVAGVSTPAGRERAMRVFEQLK